MRTFATGFFTECSVSELISINITYTRNITLLWMIFLVWVPHLFIHSSTEKKCRLLPLGGSLLIAFPQIFIYKYLSRNIPLVLQDIPRVGLLDDNVYIFLLFVSY